MKSESSIRPQAISVERCGEIAEVIFCENIKEVQRGENTIYTYDEYRTAVPYRENLLQSVTSNAAAWLERAIAEAEV